jgi:hypothetical protein
LFPCGCAQASSKNSFGNGASHYPLWCLIAMFVLAPYALKHEMVCSHYKQRLDYRNLTDR